MDFLVDVKALPKILKGLSFESKDYLPNQLFCKREMTNELLVLSMDKNKSTKGGTGLSLTSIDLA